MSLSRHNPMGAAKPDVYVAAIRRCSAIGKGCAASSNGTAASRFRLSTEAAEPMAGANSKPESKRGKAARRPRFASTAVVHCLPSGGLSSAQSERRNRRTGPDSAHRGLRSRLASDGDDREGSANSWPFYSRSPLRWESVAADPGFLWLQGNRERKWGEKGKQDKGSVSRPCPNDCLHIVFSRDLPQRLGDSLEENFRNPALFFLNRETRRG